MFDKFATTYQEYNIIQKRVIKEALPFLKSKVIDLGCGNTPLCLYKEFKFYLGIDNSPNMLKLNPCNSLCLDFNDNKTFEEIKKYDFEQIVSFSALQWADNLEKTLNNIFSLKKDYYLAIFTSNTFKTLHQFLELKSPIYSREEILAIHRGEVKNYRLYFKSPTEMLNYIKFSGVSGGVQGNISKIKKFIREFPFNYLEFEIVLINSSISF